MRRLLTVSTLAVIGCGTTAQPMSRATGPLLLGAPTDHAVVIVRIPAPWYAPNFMIRHRFAQAAPEFQRVPGLLRKYFTITDNRRFGGIYLWDTRSVADAFFSAAWHERMLKKYGTPAQVDVFDARFVVEGASSASGDAVALLIPVGGSTTDTADQRLERTMQALYPAPGMVRTYLLRSSDQGLAALTLWTNREAAKAFLATAGALRPDTLTWFSAPVLIEGTARTVASGR
jgi:heme-degrading monooxygenase HmoA